MCLFGSAPKAPDPPPLAPAPKAPSPPPAPAPAPEPLQDEKTDVGVKTRQSKKAQANQISKGTSSLRIPLNVGGNNSGGGYNL